MRHVVVCLLLSCILMATAPRRSCAGPEESMAKLEHSVAESLAGGLKKAVMVLSPAEAAELAAFIKERHKEIEGVVLTDVQAAILAGYIVGVRAVIRSGEKKPADAAQP